MEIDRMKKIYSLLFIVAIVFVGFVIFNFFLYEEAEEFFNFPIPKSAEIMKKEENVIVLKWAGASGDEGITKFYELYLKKEGWEVREREGASVIYVKEGKEIDLLMHTDELTIIKKE